MATTLDPASLTCATDDHDDQQAVAFVSHPLSNDVIPNWWLYCRSCVERFTDPDFAVVYLSGHQPAADHPRHVHIRYADDISADHPTNI